MRFYWLYALARIRGWLHPWPYTHRLPEGFTGAYAGLRTFAEVKSMHPHGWEPVYCYRHADGTWSRQFRVRMTAEEIDYERIAVAGWIEQADRHDAEERLTHALEDAGRDLNRAIEDVRERHRRRPR